MNILLPKPARTLVRALILLSAATITTASWAAGLQSDDVNLKGYNYAIPDAPDTGDNWKEENVAPPHAPLDKDLVPLDAGATSRLKFFIDPTTLSIGKDSVIRYVIVSRSNQGAKNVIFQGMRCGTSEVRNLAFGQDDGSWTPAVSSQWQRISTGTANQAEANLRNYYFCDGVLIANNRSAIIKSLTSFEPLRLPD